MTWYSVSCWWKTKTPAFKRLWPFLNQTIHSEAIKLWSECSDISRTLAVHNYPTPPLLGALELDWTFTTFHDPPRDFSHTNPDANMQCKYVWMTLLAHAMCHRPFVAHNPCVSLWQLILVYHHYLCVSHWLPSMQLSLVYHFGCLAINPSVSLWLPGNYC